MRGTVRIAANLPGGYSPGDLVEVDIDAPRWRRRLEKGTCRLVDLHDDGGDAGDDDVPTFDPDPADPDVTSS